MHGIRDINGAYCPMGCGETLHLMEGGLISCLAPRCPDKGAAQKILSYPEADDVVLFGADSFTVLHPLRERLGDLFACGVHAACNRLGGPPEGKTGYYRVRFTGNDELQLEHMPEGLKRPGAGG